MARENTRPLTPNEARCALREAAGRVDFMSSIRPRVVPLMGGTMVAGFVLGRFPRLVSRGLRVTVLMALRAHPMLNGSATPTRSHVTSRYL